MDSDSNLEIRNLVHQLAAQSWKDAATPSTSVVEIPNFFTFTSHSQQQRPSTNSGGYNKIPLKTVLDVKKVAKPEPPRSTRRIQPVSIPRRPPDIQNLALFPTIGDANNTFTSTTAPKNPKRHSEGEANPFSRSGGGQSFDNNNTITSTDLKLKQLESKLRGQACEEVKPSPSKIKFRKSLESAPQQAKHISPTLLINKSEDLKNKATKELRKVPRSAELFAELTPEMITEVDSIAEQYSSLIDNNLCRSVLEEFTFLLKLISSCGGTTSVSMERIGRLSTVAQQVYFVIKVLSLQLDSSLTAVDPKIIQVLIQKYPHRIPKLIRKHFEKWAAAQIEKKGSVEPEDISTQKPSEFHQCVTFRSETDGRPNFPNQGDFHAFCKQRDLFYSIKNFWEDREQTSFTESETTTSRVPSAFMRNSSKNNVTGREPDALYPKIKALFNMNSSCGNLSHLASLFTSQYLLDSSEKRQNLDDEGIKDEQMSNLLRSNPNRLAQLQNRMSTATIASHSTIGSRSEDPLAFSKYFLMIGNSPAFNQHLIDRVTFEISQIEASVESAESFEPKEIELLVRKCILLAKLLGYLVFLPYSDEGPNKRAAAVSIDKESLVSKQLELRSYQKPPIDLKSKLVIAFRQKRLTFTIPWIIEFFSQADPVSLQLPAFKDTINLLCSIYRSHLKLSTVQKYISTVNLNYLRFWCGSLFTLDKFPDNFLYSRDDDTILNDLRLLTCDNISESQQQDQEIFLDLCDSLGEKLVGLYFASYFNKMTCILHAGLQQQQDLNATGTTTTLEVKHIRPVPAKSPVKCPTISKTVQLQLQLESSFFDSSSASVKKTVDFIADRIASNYVKSIRNGLPDERRKLAERGIFEEDAAILCRNVMMNQLQDFSETKCTESINILIGDSISPAALRICQTIVVRKCTEKVNEWIANHIKTEMFPAVELPIAIAAVPSKADCQENENNVPETKPAFEAMISLHRSLKKLHQGKSISEECLDEILVSKPLRDEAALAGTIVDFGMALLTFCPSMLTPKRQDQLTLMWIKHWNREFKLLNPRNLMMMQDSKKWTAENWKLFTNIVKNLISHKVLNLEILEQDCLTLLRQDCPSQLFSHLSHFLKELVSSFEVSTERDMKSRELLDWVAWYCSINENDSEDGGD